jgi:hypothetical protein
MMSLSSSRVLPSHFHNLTSSFRFPLCGVRSLSPMLMLLSSPHIIGSPNRYSATGIPSWISNLCLRTRVGMNSSRLLSHHIVGTVEDSVLGTEMTGLESQEVC